MIRIGVKVPNDGAWPTEIGLGTMAALAEDAGFDSVWTTDHIVQPKRVGSAYAFTADARHEWEHTTPWFDSLVAATAMACATSRIEIGLAVLVAPLREPIATAKQIASIDALAGGRFVCGVGAGWMREEYQALGVDFSSRGGRLDEWIALVRRIWTGDPGVFAGEHFALPVESSAYPTPARPVPVLIGGLSPAALRRAGRNDGWVGHANLSTLDLDRLAEAIETIHSGSRDTDPSSAPRITTRLGETAGQAEAVRELLPRLAAIGVDDVIVDADWTDPEAIHRDAEIMKG